MATHAFQMPDVFGEGPSSAELADEERRKALRARVHNLADMLAVESEQAEPLLGPLVRRGMPTVLGAFGGAGKSTMGLAMVKAIVTGGDFLGYRGEGGCKALIVDLEQGISIAQQSVMKAFYPADYEPDMVVADVIDAMELGPEAERISYCDWQEGVTLHEAGPDLDVLEEIIERERPDVVMIDPVYKLFMGSDTNENIIIGAFIQQIDRLRVKYGFALILPMHPRKPPSVGGSLTMHDLYGSAIWSWWAFVVLMLKRGPTLVDLKFEKDRSAALPVFTSWELTYEVMRGFRRDVESLGADSNLPGHRRVWDLLVQSSPRLWSRKDIAGVLEMSEKTVKRHTERIKRDHDNAGKYAGLVMDTSPTSALLYGYTGAEVESVNAIKDEFNATEEGF